MDGGRGQCRGGPPALASPPRGQRGKRRCISCPSTTRERRLAGTSHGTWARAIPGGGMDGRAGVVGSCVREMPGEGRDEDRDPNRSIRAARNADRPIRPRVRRLKMGPGKRSCPHPRRKRTDLSVEEHGGSRCTKQAQSSSAKKTGPKTSCTGYSILKTRKLVQVSVVFVHRPPRPLTR